ncbi:nuclear valosin-containing protein-like [Anopheles nili]|uniref:nuclear valosin-containing protein-like n=1 Tax=Anopheles nili TaxID=185578 RepID=UPI00237BDF35|nr:nuclear valosin-containing protein-like [Anopheles nili]
MARELQQRYRDYHRRKTIPFRMHVEQAYRTVLHSYGLDSNASSDPDEEGASEVEVLDEAGANTRNQMSNTLTNMYMNNRAQPSSTQGSAADQNMAGPGADGEAIDISSDEEDEPAGTIDDRLGGDNSNYIQKFVAGNKHVTVTKLMRINKHREEESSNASNESGTGNAADRLPPVTKRRRVEPTKTAMTLSLVNGKLPSKSSKLLKSDQMNRNATNGGSSATPASASAAGQRLKKYRKEVVSRMVSTTFDDIGGMDRILKNLCELLMHVKHPEIYQHIGLPPPRGFLLHGPPGSGKSLLAEAIAGQLGVDFIEVPATELVAGVSGESEERIRDIFEQAVALSPCVLFIDEIDAISSNRINAQKDMERRIVAQLLSSLDMLGKHNGIEGVIVIGATNRADVLDPALRRIGRFDQEISLGIPDRAARSQILRIICRKLKISESIDFAELAKLTPGYVGADLLALATRAANTAVKRLLTKHETKFLAKETMDSANVTNVAVVASSDDVVAIDDEPDEVVNLDDEKEEQKGESKLTPMEESEKGDEKTTEETGNESKSETPKDPQANEIEAISAEADSVEPKVTDQAKSTDDDKMDVDVVLPAVEKQVIKEATNKDADAENDQPMTDVKSDNQTTSSANTAADSSTFETGINVERKVKQLPPQELTLEQMLNLLLNQQNPLPSAELEGLCIEREDFMESLRTVQPSAKREGFITVPDVTWNDIGSLGDIREELKLAILAPVKFPQRLKLLGLNAPSGVLLCGPPGCGKTLLAKAVANEAGINFISVKGPELLNMYVGESERAVRQCFQRARNSAPCVIFFDEFDSLCPKRSDTAEGSAGTRVVNQLLTEMDGIEERKGVFLMAATNRPDIVDPAVLRPGRLDKILYVGLPAKDDRVDILRALTKNRTQPPLADDVEFVRVAELTDGYTGADLAGLVRQASLQTLKDSIVACGDEEHVGENAAQSNNDKLCLTVRMAHFLEAIRNIKPSVNTEDKKHYEKLRVKYGVNGS